jgi:glycosyltransferase involved in cell wall biosynthesis
MYVAKYGRKDLVYRVLRLLERLSYAVADVVITTNESSRDIAQGRGRQAPERVFVVGSGPDLDRFTVTESAPRDDGSPTSLVGYVGIMGDQDGVDHLIRAAHHVVHDLGRGDVRFLCIGGGPALEDMQLLAEELDLADVIEFTGFLYGDQMRTQLARADLCVDPEPVNGYSEYCTTNKVLEYMALGKPVVQYDRLEGRRSAGDAALYATANDPAALGDRIVEALDDPDGLARMGATGRRRMEDVLGWSRQRDHLYEAYRSIASG